MMSFAVVGVVVQQQQTKSRTTRTDKDKASAKMCMCTHTFVALVVLLLCAHSAYVRAELVAFYDFAGTSTVLPAGSSFSSVDDVSVEPDAGLRLDSPAAFVHIPFEWPANDAGISLGVWFRVADT